MGIAGYLPIYCETDVASIEERDTSDDRPEQGAPVTFGHLAARSVGSPLLAVLKADVDRLGRLFSEGLGAKVSVAREAALSRMLNFFFTTSLSDWLEMEYPNTYTVFAGGDDLCLIGPWNEIVDLASDLNTRFREFVACNPSISISMGLEVINAHHPAGRAVVTASEALEQSKDKGRNSVNP